LERMVGLGLATFYHDDPRRSKPALTESNFFYTWMSILTKEQLEQLELKQREKWP